MLGKKTRVLSTAPLLPTEGSIQVWWGSPALEPAASKTSAAVSELGTQALGPLRQSVPRTLIPTACTRMLLHLQAAPYGSA